MFRRCESCPDRQTKGDCDVTTNSKPSPVTIDEAHLDVEWVRQPSLMLSATDAEADADHEHAVAEAKLELVKAELTLAIKQTPSEFELDDKVPEYIVKAAVLVQPQYQEAMQAVLKARHRKAVMAGRVTALAHKRTSLENVTMLETINYHSEPRTGGMEGIKERVNAAKTKAAFHPIEKRTRKNPRSE